MYPGTQTKGARKPIVYLSDRSTSDNDETPLLKLHRREYISHTTGQKAQPFPNFPEVKISQKFWDSLENQA
jgi:hypothetical protein